MILARKRAKGRGILRHSWAQYCFIGTTKHFEHKTSQCENLACDLAGLARESQAQRHGVNFRIYAVYGNILDGQVCENPTCVLFIYSYMYIYIYYLFNVGWDLTGALERAHTDLQAALAANEKHKTDSRAALSAVEEQVRDLTVFGCTVSLAQHLPPCVPAVHIVPGAAYRVASLV